MTNLTHFEIRVGDATYPPAQDKPLLFRPRLGRREGAPFATLLGYDPPEGVTLPPPGSHVIVPRFAAAIAMALDAKLVPYTIPQKHLGQRGAPGGGAVVLSSLAELELAPTELAFKFPDESFYGRRVKVIQRMVGGGHTLRVRGWGDFAPITDPARDMPDGGAHFPPMAGGVHALIVPQSGPCVELAREIAEYVLVTSTTYEDGTVDLYFV